MLAGNETKDMNMQNETDTDKSSTEIDKSAVQRFFIFVLGELKFFFVILAGQLPMLMFLDFGLGIHLYRDYGVAETVGFAFCLIFYSEFTTRLRR